MFPTVASDPNEAPSLPLWMALWLATPVLICAVRLSTLPRVFGGGVWLAGYRPRLGPSTGSWPPERSTGCVLASSGVEAGRRGPGRIIIPNQNHSNATEKRPVAILYAETASVRAGIVAGTGL